MGPPLPLSGSLISSICSHLYNFASLFRSVRGSSLLLFYLADFDRIFFTPVPLLSSIPSCRVLSDFVEALEFCFMFGVI